MKPTLTGLVVLAALACSPAFAAKVPLTILHTNDVHSHYRPDKGPFGLGGIGRIATTIRRERAKAQNSILLDGGDWSEGNIYYNLEAGRTALEMMNVLGYDAAVIGNHDWLNGPDRLMTLLGEVPPRFQLLAANLDFSKYDRGAELSKFIQPYKILNVGGLKVAVIGLVTYELIYDKFFAPVAITNPYGLVRRLSARLKKEGADLVVVISHNGMAANKLIAATPNVDIVIHAHDHEKLPQPLVVEHDGKTAIMVEAQCWGFYVGRLDLVFDTETKKVSVAHYELIQQDDTIPEDPEVVSLVNNYDHELTEKYGDIFHDHLAESHVDVRRESSESLYGNLLTDAYREATGADLAFEQVSLTSGELSSGVLNTADIFNALTAIWNPLTGKSWTLKTMRMRGDTLSWVLNFVLSAGQFVPGGLLSVSGVHLIYDPTVTQAMWSRVPGRGVDENYDRRHGLPVDDQLRELPFGSLPTDPDKKPLKSLEIGGAPVVPDKEYLVAVPEGINQAIVFVEAYLKQKIDRTDVRDTGLEDWRVLTGYLEKHSPLEPGAIARGGRIATLQPDLALYHDQITLERDGTDITGTVTVLNLGTTISGARRLTLSYDKTPLDTRDDPNPADMTASFDVPAIAAGGQAEVAVELKLPIEFEDIKVPVYFQLSADENDHNKSNDGTWLLVAPSRPSEPVKAARPRVSSRVLVSARGR